jgi:hypothetical protein
MAKTRITLERKFDTKIRKAIPPVALRAAAFQVAEAEIDLIRKRTERGIDKDGKPFRRHSTRYFDWKSRFIKRGWKYNRRKAGGGFRSVAAKTTAFAADRAGQFMRLEGRMFSDMYVAKYSARDTPNGIVLKYELDFKTARSKRIADYHIRLGAGKGKVKRKFWGGVTTDKERAALLRVLRRELKGKI